MLAGTGTLAVGGTALMAMGSEPARANVTISDDLEIPNANHSGKDGSVSDVVVNVSGSWSFSTNGATEYSLDLAVDSAPDAGDWTSIDWTDDSALTNSTGGSYELSGSILDHPAWESADFSAGAEETNTTDVPVRVLLTVRNGEETVADAGAETVATVEVTNETIAVSAEVVGDGSIDIQM